MPQGYFSSVDPFNFSIHLNGNRLFPGTSGLSIDGHPAAGKLWVNLDRNTYARMQGGKKLIRDQNTLSKTDAEYFARFFKAASNAAKIPWIFGPAGFIPVLGQALGAMTTVIDGLQRLGQPPINSDQLAVLMAEGGSFIQTIAEERPTHLTATIFYTVKVGNEVRMYGICSATYGLNVVG